MSLDNNTGATGEKSACPAALYSDYKTALGLRFFYRGRGCGV
jgi:hypothetical protein